MTRPLRRPLPLVVLCVVLVALLGVIVRGRNAVTRLDADVVGDVAAARSATLVDVAHVVTHFGDALWAGLGLLALGGVLVLTGRLTRAAALLPLASLLLGAAVSAIAKIVVGRPRPPLSLHEVLERSSGFPSGHSTQSAAGWLALGLVLALTARTDGRPAGWWVAAGAVVAVLVGASRVVLGVHSPTDVLAGWTIGLTCAVLVVGAAWRRDVVRRGERAQAAPAGAR